MTKLSLTGLDFLNLGDLGNTYKWIDVKQFVVPTGRPDDAYLELLIRSPWFDDSYSAPSSAEPPVASGLHGPYLLSTISKSSYEAVPLTAVRERLSKWWASVHFTGETSSVPLRFSNKYLLSADKAFELPDTSASARHDGAPVGAEGFLEFVLLNPSRTLLTVLVASDD